MFTQSPGVTARVVLASLAFGLTSAAHADLIVVPADHATIDAAIDAATPGDIIEVAPGVYHEHINFDGKAITVRSAAPSDPITVANTIIDGGGADVVVRFESGEQADSVLSGFTITNGAAENGGGLLIDGSHPMVTDCVITQNEAIVGGGGAIMRSGSRAQFLRCRFTLNDARSGGGAFCLEDSVPMFVDCFFDRNTGFGGGGLYVLNANAFVLGCTFFDNEAQDAGGGIQNRNESHPVIVGCTFDQNAAGTTGGGMSNDAGCLPTVSNCVFIGNTASQRGGGMNCASVESALVTNCLFIDNVSNGGGGMSISGNSHPTLRHCTFEGNEGNQGGGMEVRINCMPRIESCTFRRNTATASGGGINNTNGMPDLIDCVFIENSADVGGGGMANVHAFSTPTLTRCLFVDNEASSGGALGGTSSSQPELIDTSFFCNLPDQISTPFTDGGDNRMVACDGAPATGACCLGSTCVVTSESACLDAGGVYLGDTSGCAGSCVAPCPGDTNGDGAVDFNDLVTLLSAWGICP